MTHLTVFLGTLTDTAGGEEEDDGNGHSCGEERRGPGSVQWLICFPLQTGTCGSLHPAVLYESVCMCISTEMKIVLFMLEMNIMLSYLLVHEQILVYDNGM